MLELIALGALAAATPVATVPVQSAPNAIAAAVADCWAAVGATGVDRGRLKAAGWSSAGADDPDAVLEPFLKAAADPTIMVPRPADATSCAVIADLSGTDQAQPTLNAIHHALTPLAADIVTERSGASFAFLSGSRIAMIDRRGTKDQPGLRIVVGYHSAEKK